MKPDQLAKQIAEELMNLRASTFGQANKMSVLATKDKVDMTEAQVATKRGDANHKTLSKSSNNNNEAAKVTEPIADRMTAPTLKANELPASPQRIKPCYNRTDGKTESTPKTNEAPLHCANCKCTLTTLATSKAVPTSKVIESPSNI